MRCHDRVLGLGRLLLLPTWLFALSAAQAADQCVACHTDPRKLQALVQPPTVIAQEEGEG